MNLFKRPIKAILIILITSITLWGCSMYHYQIHQVKTSNNLSDTLMVFDNNTIEISYDFWSVNGSSYTCTVENLTDSLIYLNMEMSHLIYNGYANSYYSSKTITNSVKISTTITNSDPNMNLALGKSVAVTQDKIIIIPPHSRKNIPTFAIGFQYFNCDLKRQTSFSMIEFNRMNSPVKFSNLLYYQVGETNKWENTQNDFWISSIKNLDESKITEYAPEVICGRKTGFTTRYNPFRTEFNYMIMYY